MSRPRLLALIDQGSRPLTLLIAPAGFGKTVIASEWAALPPVAGWLSIDAGDTSLLRFWAHLHAALSAQSAHLGALVEASISSVHRPSPPELGRLLADELLDVHVPVRLVLDDLHLATGEEVLGFLSGLFEVPPVSLRLVITTRTALDLPLARMRVHNTVNELRATDLLFSEEETSAFWQIVAPRNQDLAAASAAQALWQRTGGWAAGLRLAAIPMQTGQEPPPQGKPLALDCHLLSLLLQETLAEWPLAQQEMLLCAALPVRFSAALLAAISGASMANVVETIRIATAADLCRRSLRFEDDWLEFHPLFREGLLNQLGSASTPEARATLHRRAALWLEDAGFIDSAIEHWLDAGEVDVASRLAETHLHHALARENWPAMARYLERLPDDLVQQRPQLMMARAWLAHIRGRYRQKRDIAQAVEVLMEHRQHGPEQVALQAELDVLKLDNASAVQANPDKAIATARRALAALPDDRRYPIGIAGMMLGMALHSQGQRDAAEAALTRLFEQEPDRLDAASIRGLYGLCMVALQAGDLTQAETYARNLVEFATHNHLRLTEGWGRVILADVLYERNLLQASIDQNEQIARDHEYYHFYCVLESQFTLAQAYIAAGRISDARRSWQDTREFLVAANAVEQLAIFNAYDAYLALSLGDADVALGWASVNQPELVVTSLFAMLNPASIRALILAAAGTDNQMREAAAIVENLRVKAVHEHFGRPLVRLDALSAVLHYKLGDLRRAEETMQRSLGRGLPGGYVRAYLDMHRLFPAAMAALLAGADLPAALQSSFAVVSGVGASGQVEPDALDDALPLTRRERQILAALDRRLTYDEIAGRFFISPHTVKRHACNIYAKLGVTGRRAALGAARERGWLA